ncbi:MAG: hypothetical protein [Chaetfec virus UA24_244]|nr:MAG: hypothetical protein [Chaetfec virus UA24_244]
MAKPKHYRKGGNRPTLPQVLETITAAALLIKTIIDLIKSLI